MLKYRNKLRVDGGGELGGWKKWVMGIEEGTCWDEYWVLYVSDKSWESTPEAKTTLYVSSPDSKLLKKKKDSDFNVLVHIQIFFKLMNK